jgi:hypothetical protein
MENVIKANYVTLNIEVSFKENEYSDYHSNTLRNAEIQDTEVRGILKVKGTLVKTLYFDSYKAWAAWGCGPLDSYMPKFWTFTTQWREKSFFQTLCDFILTRKWENLEPYKHYSEKIRITESTEFFVATKNIDKIIS